MPTDPLEGDLGSDAPLPPSKSDAPASGPIVHVINEMPDEDRGVIKLARHLGTTTQAGANIIVFTTNYEEIWTRALWRPRRRH